MGQSEDGPALVFLARAASRKRYYTFFPPPASECVALLAPRPGVNMIATESSLARLAPTISRKLAFTFFLTLCASIFTLSAFARKVTIITFDPLGSVQTMPMSINAGGALTGPYSDGTTTHRFLMIPACTITTFDGPCATPHPPARL